jgi:hypothetical protein
MEEDLLESENAGLATGLSWKDIFSLNSANKYSVLRFNCGESYRVY